MARKHQVLPLHASIRSGGADSVLAQLIRTVMGDLGIDREERYLALMGRYIRKAEAYPDARTRMISRQGLETELLRESISWKTFMRGLEFLNVETFTLEVVLKRRDGSESSHSTASGILSDKEAGNVLGDLLSKILFDLKIRGEAYEKCISSYIERACGSAHAKQKSALRAAIAKDLFKPNLTWKTLVKGIQFVDCTGFTIVLTIKRAGSKQPTVHRVNVNIDSAPLTDEEEDE